jgi:hypothetical protein
MTSKPALPNSKHSLRSKLAVLSACAAALLLSGLSFRAVGYVQQNGWTLWFGDAQAHLGIARRIVDSRTPGYEQIGTVWLPLPHWLMLPLVKDDALWRNGLAGAIPSACAYVLAGLFFFLALRRIFGAASAWAGLAIFALNPNLLYLQSTPMTESLVLAFWMALFWFSVRFRETQSPFDVLGAAVAALAGTLTRYEGWFLLPFVALYFLFSSRAHRWRHAFLFSVIAGLGPIYWLAHNAYLYSNPLEFYSGPYSAKAIYQRALDQNMARYPGDHDAMKALQYYLAAARLVLGVPLFWLGLAGSMAALMRRAFWPFLLMALVPAFYVLSVYSSGTPIFVPNLWPNSWYNTRYAISALPMAALGGAALVAGRWRAGIAVAVPVVALSAWAMHPKPEDWICWKESQVNSEGRRAYTAQAAAYLRGYWRPGDGIVTSFGDLAGVYREAGIPLRETLHEGNGPAWEGAVTRPDLMLFENWAVATSGDKVSAAMEKTRRSGPRWERVKMIAEKYSPVVEIWRRVP